MTPSQRNPLTDEAVWGGVIAARIVTFHTEDELPEYAEQLNENVLHPDVSIMDANGVSVLGVPYRTGRRRLRIRLLARYLATTGSSIAETVTAAQTVPTPAGSQRFPSSASRRCS